ncbi:CPBP family intramembrane glutamic endopeptidase [Prochlorococcus marinus]|nr:CPBP family intramembrane glutamic endopeptidase [Prochlorococcus marinus]KGG12875.1 putative membrane associated protease [Prochlorococcus sp. MIT 0601]
MRKQAISQWKVLVAVLSLFLTVLIWQKGLQESFDRPSVSPRISLNQHEIALLAQPALPVNVETVFVGTSPKNTLKELLMEIPINNISDREKLLLALLDDSKDIRPSLVAASIKDNEFQLIREQILESLDENGVASSLSSLASLKRDPLIYALSCGAVGGRSGDCVDNRVSQSMALRLVASQLIPIFATFLGISLCLRQGWLLVRKRNRIWPTITPLPLSIIDMVLLVAGGFVVLGEVITPLVAIPISQVLTNGIASPIKESVNVLIGYSSMTVPPLIIFRQQLKVVSSLQMPLGGWIQWGLKPLNESFLQALHGWLLVLPFVLLISWLMTSLIGDPGGSNPLLELVLGSNNFFALGILFLTTVVLAPLFEEFIFRGALLPVLVQKQGRVLGVLISALVFALAHLSIGELPPLIVLGVGLALLRLSSGRLFPCVVMHSLWNGITFVNLLLLA